MSGRLQSGHAVSILPMPFLPVLFLCPAHLVPSEAGGKTPEVGFRHEVVEGENDSSPGAGDETPSLVVWVPAALLRLN